MVDRQIKAAAAGGLHTAHCARLARRQGPPALTPVEPATLLGADPPRDDRTHRSTISGRTSVPRSQGLEYVGIARTTLAVSCAVLVAASLAGDLSAASPKDRLRAKQAQA